MPGITPSQTVGPFFHVALPAYAGPELVAPDVPGAVRIEGVLRDGAGEPVPDGMVEVWQAHPSGRYDHPEDPRTDLALTPGFTGFGRCGTDAQGRFAFVTLKPGCVPGPGGSMQAPHIEVAVFGRGLLKQLFTRLYFPDEAKANAADPVLALVPAEQRHTLVAAAGEGVLRFDITLQGPDQTAFFDV